VSSHIHPLGWCIECAELELARLDMQEEMHVRLDRLAFAVQTLTERLDAGRIEELERRLDEFTSRWPRKGPVNAQPG
jgi:hypothetical protein